MATVPLNGATGARDPLENLLSKLAALQATATGWRAHCPACGDQNASLSIIAGEPAVLCCHAGCGYAEVIDSKEEEGANA